MFGVCMCLVCVVCVCVCDVFAVCKCVFVCVVCGVCGVFYLVIYSACSITVNNTRCAVDFLQNYLSSNNSYCVLYVGLST